MILSCVRSNVKGSLGFITMKERMCVALSRAKHLLVVVGSMRTLRKCKTWDTVTKRAKTIQADDKNGELGEFLSALQAVPVHTQAT